MALYSKKLQVRKAGVVSDIELYTTLSETDNSALAIKDGGTTAYAKLGPATDALASPLRVRKNGETYAVLKSNVKPSIAPLFAFTIDNYSNYTHMQVEAIYGDRTASPTTYTNESDKLRSSIGYEQTVASFLGTDNISRLLITATGNNIRVINPFSSWTSYENTSNSSTYDLTQCKIAVPGQKFLYVTGKNRIVVLDMTNTYKYMATRSYTAESFTGYSIPSGTVGVWNALTPFIDTEVGIQKYMYAILTFKSNAYNISSIKSYVVKFLVNTITGALAYMNHIEVVTGANTLELFDNKLYVCCDGSWYDDITRLQIIDLSDFSAVPVTINKTASMTNGYFQNILIVDSTHVYILIGVQGGGYNYSSVYYSTIANITDPTSWIKVLDLNRLAVSYFWGIYHDSGRLWVVAGNSIHIFSSLPTGFASPAKTFDYNWMIRSFAQIT